MSFCEKCGAYIPMDDTACPACGHDPEQEKKKQQQQEEARRRREEQQSRQQYQYAGAQQQEYKYGTGAASRTSGSGTYERTREENRSSGTGTADRHTRQNASDPRRPLWEDPNAPRNSYEQYAQNARQWAAESADSRYLSVLSYLGPLFLVPLFLRRGDPFAKHHANQGLTLFLFSALLSVVKEITFLGGLISAAGSIFVLVCIVKGIQSVLKGRMDKLPLIGDIRLMK